MRIMTWFEGDRAVAHAAALVNPCTARARFEAKRGVMCTQACKPCTPIILTRDDWRVTIHGRVAHIATSWLRTSVPLTKRMTSPARMPARCAPLPLTTLTTRHPPLFELPIVMPAGYSTGTVRHPAGPC